MHTEKTTNKHKLIRTQIETYTQTHKYIYTHKHAYKQAMTECVYSLPYINTHLYKETDIKTPNNTFYIHIHTQIHTYKEVDINAYITRQIQIRTTNTPKITFMNTYKYARINIHKPFLTKKIVLHTTRN